jgi:hypothetical protein
VSTDRPTRDNSSPHGIAGAATRQVGAAAVKGAAAGAVVSGLVEAGTQPARVRAGQTTAATAASTVAGDVARGAIRSGTLTRLGESVRIAAASDVLPAGLAPGTLLAAADSRSLSPRPRRMPRACVSRRRVLNARGASRSGQGFGSRLVSGLPWDSDGADGWNARTRGLLVASAAARRRRCRPTPRIDEHVRECSKGGPCMAADSLSAGRAHLRQWTFLGRTSRSPHAELLGPIRVASAPTPTGGLA